MSYDSLVIAFFIRVIEVIAKELSHRSLDWSQKRKESPTVDLNGVFTIGRSEIGGDDVIEGGVNFEVTVKDIDKPVGDMSFEVQL